MPPAPAQSTPTSGASWSTSPGLAQIRSAAWRRRPRSIGSTFACSRSARARRAGRRRPRPRGLRRAPARSTRAEAATRQPVLVVHRRLMHEVGEALLAVGSAMPVEDDASAPHDHQRRVVGGDVDEQPVVCLRSAGEHQVHEVERREIDEAHMRTRRARRPSRTARSARAGPLPRRTRARHPPASCPSVQVTCASSTRKGTLLRTWNRSIASRSWQLVSAPVRIARARPSPPQSGTTSATCRPPPTAASTRSTAATPRPDRRCWASCSDDTTAPAGSGSTA